jgi:hypothetical protein
VFKFPDRKENSREIPSNNQVVKKAKALLLSGVIHNEKLVYTRTSLTDWWVI